MSEPLMSKDKNKLIPELRFPEFVSEGKWEKKELDQFLDYSSFAHSLSC